jgi:hypothetical protein
LIYLIKRRREYRLGFAGERAVAEELNQLMLDGCRVFHDVPMEPYGNIDHVLIAPAGIFCGTRVGTGQISGHTESPTAIEVVVRPWSEAETFRLHFRLPVLA